MLFLYFIQSGGASGPIKIGVAFEPEGRRDMLQTGNPEPLTILAVRPATFELEADLHRKFAAGRIRGEWFRPSTPGLWNAVLEARGIDQDARPPLTRAERERGEARAVKLAQHGNWDLGVKIMQKFRPNATTSDGQ